MPLRDLVRLNAIVALVSGFVLCSFVRPAAFHLPESWESFAMLRFAGAGLLALGVVLWTAGDGIASMGRRAASGLLLAHVVAGSMIAIQQYAIWESAAGWITSGVFAAFAVAYAVAARRERPVALPAAG